MLTKIWDFMKGKKTYILCVGLIIKAVAEYLSDNDLSKLINTIIESCIGATIRHGVG